MEKMQSRGSEWRGKNVTQNEMIEKHLREFGSITTFESYTEYGITRLSARIKELKNKGYQFNEEWLIRKNRYGKLVSFKKYILKEGAKIV